MALAECPMQERRHLPPSHRISSSHLSKRIDVVDLVDVSRLSCCDACALVFLPT